MNAAPLPRLSRRQTSCYNSHSTLRHPGKDHPMDTPTLLTLGHSNVGAPKMLKTCLDNRVDVVLDVRSHPSSMHEQFRGEVLQQWLPASGIGYEWEPRLGGWTAEHAGHAEWARARDVDIDAYMKGSFPKQRISKVEAGSGTKPIWTIVGLRDYSWFLALPETLEALTALAERVRAEPETRIAIMCVEVLWWACHRSMIADWFADQTDLGIEHLQPKLTDHRASLGNRIDRYDPEIREAWAWHAADHKASA